MDWQELHMLFQLKFTESGDYEGTTFDEHLMDEWLNLGVNRVMSSFFPPSGKGFSDSQLSSEIIQSLEDYYTKPLYTFNDQAVRGFFPQNFYRAIEVRVKANSYCSDKSVTLATDTFNYWTFDLKTAPNATAISEGLRKMFITAEIQDEDDIAIGDADFFRMSTLLPSGYGDMDLYGIINRYLLQSGGNLAQSVEIYYERFADLYFPQKYILVQWPNTLTTHLENMRLVYTDTSGFTQSISLTKQQFNLSREVISTSRWLDYTRFMDSEYNGISHIDPLNKSTKKAPYVTVSGQQILVYNRGFNATEMTLKYIRNPRRIDHKTGQGLDMGVSLGNKRVIGELVVDEAVKAAAFFTRSEIVSNNNQ